MLKLNIFFVLRHTVIQGTPYYTYTHRVMWTLGRASLWEENVVCLPSDCCSVVCMRHVLSTAYPLQVCCLSADERQVGFGGRISRKFKNTMISDLWCQWAVFDPGCSRDLLEAWTETGPSSGYSSLTLLSQRSACHSLASSLVSSHHSSPTSMLPPTHTAKCPTTSHQSAQPSASPQSAMCGGSVLACTLHHASWWRLPISLSTGATLPQGSPSYCWASWLFWPHSARMSGCCCSPTCPRRRPTPCTRTASSCSSRAPFCTWSAHAGYGRPSLDTRLAAERRGSPSDTNTASSSSTFSFVSVLATSSGAIINTVNPASTPSLLSVSI